MNWRNITKTTLGVLSALAIGISVNADQVWQWFPQDKHGDLAWEIIRIANISVFIFATAAASMSRGTTTPSQ